MAASLNRTIQKWASPRTPIPASSNHSSPSRKIFAYSGSIPRRCPAHFPLGAWRVAASGGSPRLPWTFRDEICGSVDVRAVVSRTAAACPRAPVSPVGMSALRRHGPPSRPVCRVPGLAVPADRAGPAGLTTARHAVGPRPAQPPLAGPRGPPRLARLPSREVLVQDGTEGGRGRGGVPADQPVGDDALLFLRLPSPLRWVRPYHSTPPTSRRHPGRCSARRSPSRTSAAARLPLPGIR